MIHLRSPILMMALLVTALVAPSDVFAQQDSDPTLTIDGVDTTSFPIVRITVTVRDSSGVPIPDIPSSAFEMVAGDQRLHPTNASVAVDAPGLALVLAFDGSGSMAGEPLETSKASAKSLIAQLRPPDVVAVLAFGDSVETIQSFTGDSQILNAAVDRLTASGNTPLYDAVSASLMLVQQSDAPRRAVVLLSDGSEYGGLSAVSRQTSIDLARDAATPVFAVGLGDLVDTAYLTELSGVTGGVFFLAPSVDSLESLYESIGAVLGRQHLISFDASSIVTTTELILRVDHQGVSGSASFALEPPAVPVTANSPPGDAPTIAEPADDGLPERPPPNQLEEASGGSLGDGVTGTAGNSVPVLAIAGVSSSIVLAGTALSLGIFLRLRRRREAPEGVSEEVLDLLLRRSNAPKPATREPEGEKEALPPPPVTANGEGAVLSVPLNGELRAYPIDGTPVTIGYSPDCSIILPGNGENRSERVRLWQRDGRFMLHNLSRGGRVSVGGRQISWLILEHGDSIDIGGCQITFELD